MTRAFYESVDRDEVYTSGEEAARHAFFPLVRDFVERRGLAKKRCLEIGSGRGLFQDLVADYTGVDVALSLAPRYRKAFVVASGEALPFREEVFDGVFTCAAHEHIPELERALEEIFRVLKRGGVCLFAPAWHTRPWFASGAAVRPFADLDGRGRLVKLSIPLRDSVLVRWPWVFGRRLWRLARYFAAGGRVPLRYRRLRANYERFWQSDSDACNSIDPFDVILWSRSRGIVCRGLESLGKAFFVRSRGLEMEKAR